MDETPVGRLVETIDRELREHADSGFSIPGYIAEWLAGIDQALWRLLARRAGVALTDETISGVLDAYKARERSVRKSIVKAYTLDAQAIAGGTYPFEAKTSRRRTG
jgi:hypothetical protein